MNVANNGGQVVLPSTGTGTLVNVSGELSSKDLKSYLGRTLDNQETLQNHNLTNNIMAAGMGALTASLGALAAHEQHELAMDYQKKLYDITIEKNTFDLSMADKQLKAMGQMGDLQVELAEIQSRTEVALAKVEAGKHANEVNARKDVAMVNASFSSYGYGNPSVPTKIFT